MDSPKATAAVANLLASIGEDTTRGGLADTPTRVMKAWRDSWASGYKIDPDSLLVQFDDGAEEYDEIVLEKNIPVYSHCEHHLAPFFGVAHVGYFPDKRIVGLSKLARVVDAYARRLQVQERLTREVADCIERVLKPRGVAVVVECRHMCMESRGVRTPGVTTFSAAMRGCFREDRSIKSEFYSLIGARERV
jgi:GTP cyclohydrolase I